MISLRYMLPAIALFAVVPAVSNAQSIPFCETEYQIQVQYEHWTSGNTYWATKYTTDDLVEAQMMLVLFEAALETGDLRDVLGVGWSYLLTDVRLVPKTTCQYLEYQQLLPVQSWQTRNYQLRRR